MASSINKICVISQTAIHMYSMSHWCGLWAGGIIGPYFFRDDQDRHVIVNGNRYRSVITEYFCYVKSMVYANKPATIDDLRTNIKREIAAVSADLCLKIVKNWVQRLDFCKRVRGDHAKDIEFHS